MKKYELIFDSNGGGKGCFRMSVVKDPALELESVKFAKEDEVPLFFADEEQRIIYSVAMRPNKLIPRNAKPHLGINESHQVFYTADTIKKLQENYFRQNGNSASNLDHQEDNTDGVFPFESWVVEDEKNDKSNAIGLKTITGDWVMGFKFDNDEAWNECKNGNLNGLSIEAFLGYREVNEDIINFNQQNEMIWKNLFKTVFGSEALEIATGFWAKDKEVGTKVLDKDGNPAANAEFEIDGKKVKTDADGMILAEIKAEGDEPTMTLEEALAKIKELEDKLAEVDKAKTDAEAEKVKAEGELQTMKSEKEAAATALVTMTEEKETTLAAFEKFKAENGPAKKIKDEPIDMTEEIPYEKMSNFQKMKFNKERNG